MAGSLRLCNIGTADRSWAGLRRAALCNEPVQGCTATYVSKAFSAQLAVKEVLPEMPPKSVSRSLSYAGLWPDPQSPGTPLHPQRQPSPQVELHRVSHKCSLKGSLSEHSLRPGGRLPSGNSATFLLVLPMRAADRRIERRLCVVFKGSGGFQ